MGKECTCDTRVKCERHPMACYHCSPHPEPTTDMTFADRKLTNTNIRKEIREIVTYHSEDGTSGYLLSEEQIEKIVELFSRIVEEAKPKINHHTYD